MDVAAALLALVGMKFCHFLPPARLSGTPRPAAPTARISGLEISPSDTNMRAARRLSSCVIVCGHNDDYHYLVLTRCMCFAHEMGGNMYGREMLGLGTHRPVDLHYTAIHSTPCRGARCGHCCVHGAHCPLKIPADIPCPVHDPGRQIPALIRPVQRCHVTLEIGESFHFTSCWTCSLANSFHHHRLFTFCGTAHLSVLPLHILFFRSRRSSPGTRRFNALFRPFDSPRVRWISSKKVNFGRRRRGTVGHPRVVENVKSWWRRRARHVCSDSTLNFLMRTHHSLGGRSIAASRTSG